MTARSREAARAAPAAGWIFSVAALAPLAWLAGFAILLGLARQTTGTWPTPYQPDPKDLGLLQPLLIATLPILYVGGLATLGALLIGGCLTRVRVGLHRAGLRSWHLYVGTGGMAAVLGLAHATPLMTWLFD